MAPDWLNYVSLACGVGGLITGGLTYRRTGELKALDLRLELRKLDMAIVDQAAGMPSLLEDSLKSKKAAYAAIGMAQSGSLALWMEIWNEDKETFDQLKSQLPDDSQTYRWLPVATLEDSLVSRHRLKTMLDEIAQRHEGSLAEDGDIRKRVAARRSPGHGVD